MVAASGENTAISLWYVRPVVLSLLILACTIAVSAQVATDTRDANQGDASSELEGRTIVNIVPVPEQQPLLQPEFDQRLGLRIGAPLSLADVRAAISALYLTGRYHDIAVEAQPSGAGVELRIVTEFNYFVSGVDIGGTADPPSKEQLRTATKLELGGLFTEDLMEPAASNLEERLHANGLYGAQVSYHVDFSSGGEEAGIYFEIQPGARARFDGINLSGNLTQPPEIVGRTAGWRRGLLFVRLPGWRYLTEQRLQSGIGKLERSVQKGDHLAARVTLEGLNYHQDTNRVTPSLRIDSGPELEVNVTGAKISTGRLRQLIPIYEERTVDNSLLLEGQRNLLEYFQGKGYFEAHVEFEQSQPAPGQSVIGYSIDRGLRSKLANIDIAGNRYFDSATVRERLLMTPARFPRYPQGRFSPGLLQQDTNTILDLYRSNGFRDAQVVSSRNDDYKGKPGQFSVVLEIKEGPQWIVHGLEIEGVLPADDGYLRSVLRSMPGQPYSEANIAADRDAILNYYFNNGYQNATFDWTRSAGPLATQVDLHFVVRPGKQEFVRNVFVRGLEHTRAGLVARRITLKPKEPLSRVRISESQQNLYDLGIFSKVQTAIQNPDGDEDSKNVLFHLDEAKRYSYNVGFGAELARIGGGVTTFDAPAGTTAFSPRISLGLSRLNFLGLGHIISLQTLVSTLEERAELTYQAPQLAGHQNLSLTFSSLFDDSSDVRTFTSHRLEGSVQLAQKVSRGNSLQYRYTIRRVTIPATTLKISPELVPILSQPDRAGIVSMSYVQDRRDDPTDSHRGYLNTIDLGSAWKGFGSATDYTRIVLRSSTYHPIGRDVVLAQTSQFGYLQRLGGTADLCAGGAPATELCVPLAERFYSGGASTDRAFPDNQAGPRDLETGFPLGGDAFLFHSTELRFPLFGDNIGGVLFHDIGNVYSGIDNVNFHFSQDGIHDFGYAVNSFGFGIRYRTPVGPLRVDFSLSPDSPRFFGFSGTLQQLLDGQGRLVNQRINIFQFHFSLGQTF
jgi:outer membrane protein insertion porin family